MQAPGESCLTSQLQLPAKAGFCISKDLKLEILSFSADMQKVCESALRLKSSTDSTQMFLSPRNHSFHKRLVFYYF